MHIYISDYKNHMTPANLRNGALYRVNDATVRLVSVSGSGLLCVVRSHSVYFHNVPVQSLRYATDAQVREYLFPTPKPAFDFVRFLRIFILTILAVVVLKVLVLVTFTTLVYLFIAAIALILILG